MNLGRQYLAHSRALTIGGWVYGCFFVLVGGTHIPYNEIEMTRLWQPTGSSLLTEQWSWEESTKVWSPFTICGQYIAYLEEISGLGAQGQKVIHKSGIFFFFNVMSQGLRLCSPHSAASITSRGWNSHEDWTTCWWHSPGLNIAGLWAIYLQNVAHFFGENLFVPTKHFKVETPNCFLSQRFLNSCVCVCDSVMSVSVTPWTVTWWTPLFMGFSR